VDVLAYYGADVNYEMPGGASPLYNAVVQGWSEVAKDLIHYGSDIEELTLHGGSLLHVAVQGRQLHSIRALVQSHVNGAVWVDQAMDDMATPLYNASMQGWVPGMELLVELKADLHQTTQGGLTLMHAAAAEDQALAITALAEWKAPPVALLRVDCVCVWGRWM
jgi:ankyrin repeat protein